MYKINLGIFLALILVCVSCEKDAIVNESAVDGLESVENKGQVYNRIIDLGFNEEDIVDQGSYYLVENDIVFRKNDILEKGSLKQARTYDLVSDANADISVYMETNFPTLNNEISGALDDVISEYNNLNTKLNFTRTTEASEADITIIMDNSIREINGKEYDVCGRGGFPTVSGKPFDEVAIAEKTLTLYNLTSNEMLVLLLAHEIGHNIGFRHTNWESAGEPSDPYGAVLIDGTPESDSESFMNGSTCGYVWNGFSEFDKIALETMYPGSGTTPTNFEAKADGPSSMDGRIARWNYSGTTAGVESIEWIYQKVGSSSAKVIATGNSVSFFALRDGFYSDTANRTSIFKIYLKVKTTAGQTYLSPEYTITKSGRFRLVGF